MGLLARPSIDAIVCSCDSNPPVATAVRHGRVESIIGSAGGAVRLTGIRRVPEEETQPGQASSGRILLGLDSMTALD